MDAKNQIANRHTMLADAAAQRFLQEEYTWSPERSKEITFRNIADHAEVPEWIKRRHQIILEESQKLDIYYSVT